ncbi:GTP cyclohydrolase II RibA [Alsobacter sp. SYSU M60028]|uniref:GTP cyclohydrolase-2 n=1 Tax=Alsobacter ponti TaxID=2962936 RepID=A0ABT1LCB6_9HYPH|nr:GTP cyclohydrolase II RibA [Alsobacter ponti]MCP8938390.1 GTP cyclohydrolase II RibA [Alsobacter ponti]
MDRAGALASLLPTPEHAKVERAIGELRAGRPVLLRDHGEAAIALGMEALDARAASALEQLADGRARLVLPPARLRRLGAERATAGVIALPSVDIARVESLALKLDARIDAPVSPAGGLDMLALELASLSLVLPAMIVVPVPADAAPEGVVCAEGALVRDYRRAMARQIHIVSRAPVPLEGAPQTEFVVFRGGEGLRDQVAIIVGQPDFSQPVAVRLHSACLTGDLFGSLKCDCGDQLRGTVRWMAENGGGILLYLDQEGRGNGIANKIRAYKLQHQGYDTYDADEILGFDLDQRRFDFAAEMLKQLGVTRVMIMTNNPVKIAALQAAGLEVAEDRRVHGRPTVENVLYLASKRDRAGHFIDLDDLVAHKPIRD